MTSLPQYCPPPAALDDLELLLNGGLAPRISYDEQGPLALPLTDRARDDLARAGGLELTDAEGFPLAQVTKDGGLTSLATRVDGPFRRLHLSPAEVHARYPDSLTVLVAAPPTEDDLALIRDRRAGRHVVLLALNGHGTPQDATTVGLLRSALAAADLLGDADVVAAPLAAHGDPELDHELGQQVARNYAAGEILALPGTGDHPSEIAAIVGQDQPAPDEQGLVVFFTGLSGSGKSTLARALHDLILEDGSRTVTSLDGDVVRRHLSAGLTFSKEDRETNIRRIGWVAAEIARHRGVAICSPIAPFDATRQDVRRYVADAGGAFFLVYVATPLAECERRDKKGLYAKARRGEIPEFTGISSPYEEPADAAVRVDTTGRSIEDALEDVLRGLRKAGYLDERLPASAGGH